CEECGELFYKQPKQIEKSKHHFCSRKCYKNYRDTHRGYTQPHRKSNELLKIEHLAKLREEMINRMENINCDTKKTKIESFVLV
ncbi:MAG: hypothetical protein ACOC56_05480, partial [Atribacterota bacterium]